MVAAIRFVTGVFGSVIRLYFMPFLKNVNRCIQFWSSKQGEKGLLLVAIYRKEATIVRFTPDVAKMYLGYKYEHQRDIDKVQVAILASEMKSGNFTDSKIDIGVLNNERSLLNGQHTMNAIIQSECTYDLTVTEHYAQNSDDLAHLYETFDLQRRRRYADSMRVYRLTEVLGMNSTSIENLGAALAWARSNFGADRMMKQMITFTDRREWSKLWKWEMHAILEAISPCDKYIRNTLLKQPVLSVALITMRYQPEKSFAFWRQVAWQDGLKQYDPRQTLRKYLAASTRTNEYSGNKVEPYEISRAVALAWNAYMAYRVWRYVVVRDTTKLMTLAGTPYNGNQSPHFLSLLESPNKDKTISSLWVPDVPVAPSEVASSVSLI